MNYFRGMSVTDNYRMYGPRLFWRLVLHDVTFGLLPWHFDELGEIRDRISEIKGQRHLLQNATPPPPQEGEK